ncbi:hypothetical protein Lbys_1864 [Leadbetterella byssophila DSM 17132]|uniref:Uncharacterized protein n=1 Tax=Leadbetterella byssophila (strain DSM 17132 / JCM 16389 / KACC 11308 / NBRC 106382 / 4M15) TaxID=649349 RepID=E4RR81_LEAB4|nr:hypothetical protein [Leadbetterella byssophila]ADQ17567.1 hypothetical protein Lbys_1864 [Leadbetterella byssophila DSM 17132]
MLHFISVKYLTFKSEGIAQQYLILLGKYRKEMKKVLGIGLIALTMMGCEDKDPYLKTLQKCNLTGWAVAGTLTNVQGFIVKDADSNYYIEPISITTGSDLYPCNLPEEYKKDQSLIRFSGNIMTQPNNDASFELTSIELVTYGNQ